MINRLHPTWWSGVSFLRNSGEVLGLGGPELEEALRQQVRSRLAAHAYPREIEFVDELPKTPSGKVQRFLLRNQGNPPAR